VLNRETKAAFLSIVIIIPLSAYALWTSEQNSAVGVITIHHKVLATFYPIYKFTQAVGGGKVDVSTIIPLGVEPHDWEPSVQEIERMKDADIVIINGGGLEPWITKLSAANPNLMMIDTSKGIRLLDRGTGLGNEEGKTDPHIWLDPELAKIQVQNIANGLSKVDPDNKNYYQENAEEYEKKLDLLDRKIRTELSSCDKKDFLAFHDAFSYFSSQYGLHQNTIVGGLNPEAEPTAATLEQITQKAKTLGINVVFTEEAVNPEVSGVIANEIHGKVLVLSPLEVTSNNEDYIQKMEQNLSNLEEALCS
jgi:zinc transport system substrate-binding protein